jgi:WXG100 family type VII secretion target
MDQLKYSFGEIEALTAEIGSDVGKLQAAHDELKSYVQNLAASWESQAQEAYLGTQQKWDQANADLIATLHAIAQTVAQGNQDMQSTEARNASQWS